MSRKPHKLVTFERKAPLLDAFIGETDEWEEITKAYVSFESAVIGQRSEFQETTQTTSTRRSIVRTEWTPTLSALDTSCRMTYGERVFEIDQLVNPSERNKQLQLMVIERT